MRETILSLDRVSKTYGGKPAVRNVSLNVERGQITGFLGPNGAGKTTSLRMSLGILQPDSGTVSLFGGPPLAATASTWLPHGQPLHVDGVNEGTNN